MSADAPSGRSGPTDRERRPTGQRRRRRWPRSLLLLGLLLALVPLLLTLPASHGVRLTIREPRSLTRLEATWFAGEAGDAPLRHVVWSFERGQAPPALTTEFSAQRGRYRLELRVVRGSKHHIQTHSFDVGPLAGDLEVRVD